MESHPAEAPEDAPSQSKDALKNVLEEADTPLG